MRPTDPDAFADAVLLGAHQHSRIAGHTYNRRTLTKKQRTLTAALADGDGLGIEELREAYPDDWARVVATKGETLAVGSFFQNIADLATRINAYLLAGYRNTITREQMQRLLDGRLIGIHIDYTQQELCALDAENLEELLPMIGQRPERTRRRQPSATETPNTDAGVEANPAAAEDTPKAPSGAPVGCRVDPVTGRWTLALPDGEIEIDPRLETIRKGAYVLRLPETLQLPADPETLTAEQLETIRAVTS